MSIFVFNKANIEFFKQPPHPFDIIQQSPYWIVEGRICYHVHDVPEFVIHENLPIRYIPEIYDAYYHIPKDKKPLYAISSYSHAELVEMSNRLELPLGKKTQMYTKIKEEIDKSMMNFKKIDPR
jgi:hypothetical protein